MYAEIVEGIMDNVIYTRLGLFLYASQGLNKFPNLSIFRKCYLVVDSFSFCFFLQQDGIISPPSEKSAAGTPELDVPSPLSRGSGDTTHFSRKNIWDIDVRIINRLN
eukprot:TRINITY_DN3045_c0_g1_i1.p1 TRINITY_DN3045_c0_g1~~TRINITY_DN3045_c0_g1_i1.p1  ORF type:complete len:107 (-),score=4.78 TRINITY_DN3045_c0_g1_i1:116-436(-)